MLGISPRETKSAVIFGRDVMPFADRCSFLDFSYSVSDKLLHLVGHDGSQASTKVDTVQRCTTVIFKRRALKAFLRSLVRSTAPQSSNLGIEICFNSINLDFEQSSIDVISPMLLVDLTYKQARYARAEASENRVFECFQMIPWQ